MKIALLSAFVLASTSAVVLANADPEPLPLPEANPQGIEQHGGGGGWWLWEHCNRQCRFSWNYNHCMRRCMRWS
ncbi:hypothetical protein H4S06_004055 [Coemansia sp. BCRC 34490]|nr:hypothetical protein H4S06_004055 [Coemansia sp. BCRC 34490]